MAAKRDDRRQETLRDSRQALEEAAAALPPLIVVWGESDFLRAEAAAGLRRAWLERHPGGDVATIRGMGEAKPASLADVLRELSGASLFAKEKLLVVRQAEKILFGRGGGEGEAEKEKESPGASREQAFLERLEKMPASTWLALEDFATSQKPHPRQAPGRFRLPDTLPEAGPAGDSRLARGAGGGRGGRLDEEAMDLLIRAHGADLGALAGEVEKLILFADGKADINAEMVGAFLTGSVEFDIFGLTNAVEARDRAKAVSFARRIALQGTRDQRGKREDGERSAHKVLSMLAGTVQGLLRARVALARRLEAGAFAAEEKLPPWRAGRLLAAAGRFELPELRRMIGMAADQMRRVHDTGGDPLLALETMAVRFTTRGGR